MQIGEDMKLALLGGQPVREVPWPKWPRADENTKAAILDVLSSRRWTVSGPYEGRPSREQDFGDAFARHVGVRYCTPTTSGTSALTLALLAVGAGPGCEVIVPGLTWVACASSVVCVGAEPYLADIDEHNLAISPEAIEAAISERTRAVMVVHPYCRVAEVERIRMICDRHGLALIEDCSQAHGAMIGDGRIGSFGEVSCFSMQQSKVLTAGEGGAALTDDPTLWRRMEQLRCDGRMFSQAPSVGRLELREVGEVLGQNACMTEFQAAILIDRLRHLDTENDVRRATAQALYTRLCSLPGVSSLPQAYGCKYTYYNLVLKIDAQVFSASSADIVAACLSRELNAQISPVYNPMNRHRLYNPVRSSRVVDPVVLARVNPDRFNLPVAEFVRQTHITIPHPLLLDGERAADDIFTALEKLMCCRDQVATITIEDDGAAF